MKYKVGDEVKVIVEDSCGYGEGYIGKITNIEDWCYEVDGHYEYAESEIELALPVYITQDGREIYADNGKPQKLQVKLKTLTDTAVIPKYASAGAACFDLCADEDVIVAPGQTVAISTGLSFELPTGYQMKVLPRSGLSLKTPLRVIIGTVDSDYRGEVKVILWNTSETEYRSVRLSLDDYIEEPPYNNASYAIHKGDRIAQAEVIPVTQVDFALVDELSTTERGTGGFGSTGLSKDVPLENKVSQC